MSKPAILTVDDDPVVSAAITRDLRHRSRPRHRRRIVVERHGGRIDIDSRPGATVLRVTIPVRAHEARTARSGDARRREDDLSHDPSAVHEEPSS